jgi:hypothetical protein
VIKRSPYLLPTDTCAQAVAAYHQNPIIAYNEKSQIWTSDSMYSRYFSEQTTAAHIVFAYSLLRSVEARKKELRNFEPKSLTDAEKSQLSFLQMRGSAFLLTTSVAACIETVLGKAVPNLFRVSFGTKTSPAHAQELWKPIVDASIPFCDNLRPTLDKGLKNQEEVTKVVATFKSLVEATKRANGKIFEGFSNRVVIG